jgi:CDP-glycerol glycerophosphotransferase
VDADFPTNRSRELYIEKNSRWNYLIVQSDFMVEKAKACFMFEKEYLKTGYPRTDILFDDNAYDNEKIKEAIGIPKDKKVVLYLPTWRVKNRFNMQLDLEQMREKLGDDYVILVRIHHFCANGYTVPADNEFIFDLTAYRCVEELYRISDIMITDYSSVMFDFALLNKPMIFYTYDLEEYSEELRGLYVDIVKEAPGPLVYDTSQVIDVILNIASQTEKCSDRIDSFKKKYLTYECGNSCEKVVQEVFKPTRFSNKMALKKRKIKNALKPLRNHFQ